MEYPVRFWTAIGVLGNSVIALVAYFLRLEPEGTALLTVVCNAAIGVAVALTAEGAVTPLADPKLVIGTSYKATNGDGDPISVKTVTP